MPDKTATVTVPPLIIITGSSSTIKPSWPLWRLSCYGDFARESRTNERDAIRIFYSDVCRRNKRCRSCGKSSFLIFPQITVAASRLKFLDSFSSDRGNESTANLKRNTSVVHFYCVDGTEHTILVQFFPRFQPRV